MIVKFIADKVKVKTGRVDNSATVEFEVGEYQLDKIKELVGIIDQNLTVVVQDEEIRHRGKTR
jgi:hypothetical protein